jgi:hypothetical protein
MMPGKNPASARPARRRLDECHRARDQAPADHDPRDPLARAEPMQQQVARHLEQEIPDEEDAGAQAVDRFAEAEIVEHLQLRETDVDAVEIRRDVCDEEDGQQPPHHFPVGGLGRVRGGGAERCCRVDGVHGLSPVVVDVVQRNRSGCVCAIWL